MRTLTVVGLVLQVSMNGVLTFMATMATVVNVPFTTTYDDD